MDDNLKEKCLNSEAEQEVLLHHDVKQEIADIDMHKENEYKELYEEIKSEIKCEQNQTDRSFLKNQDDCKNVNSSVEISFENVDIKQEIENEDMYDENVYDQFNGDITSEIKIEDYKIESSILEDNDLVKLKTSEHKSTKMSDSCRIDDTEYKTWSFSATKVLLNLFKQNRNKVGSFHIRSMKKLWEVIASKISNEMKMNVTPANCENRWRVLERNYKKYVNNKTGQRKRFFEYSKEMDEIFGKKRNPEILYSAASFCVPLINNLNDEHSTPKTSFLIENSPLNVEKTTNGNNNGCDVSKNTPDIVTPSKSRCNKYSTPKSKMCISHIRLKHERELFAFKKTNAERKLLLEEKKLQQKIRKNDLLEERNKILKEYLEKGVPLKVILVE